MIAFQVIIKVVFLTDIGNPGITDRIRTALLDLSGGQASFHDDIPGKYHFIFRLAQQSVFRDHIAGTGRGVGEHQHLTPNLKIGYDRVGVGPGCEIRKIMRFGKTIAIECMFLPKQIKKISGGIQRIGRVLNLPVPFHIDIRDIFILAAGEHNSAQG